MADKRAATYNMTVKEMPEEERPRERMAHAGPQALSTTELLAIILRVGVGGENVVTMASRLLRDYKGLLAFHGLTSSSWPPSAAWACQDCANPCGAGVGRRLMVESPEALADTRAKRRCANPDAHPEHKEQEQFAILYWTRATV